MLRPLGVKAQCWLKKVSLTQVLPNSQKFWRIEQLVS